MFLKVFVTPDAKKERVEEKEGMLLIAVKEPAERNQANKRVRELVATRFCIPVAKVRIISGHRSRGKMLSITTGAL